MGEVTANSDRFVTAPLDPTGAVVTAVGYETEREEPGDHRGLPSPFLTFIVTMDEPVVLAEAAGERGLEVVVAGLSTEVETVRMPRRQAGLQAAVHPLAARRLFGMPAAELARLSVEGEDVLGATAPRLRERLAEAAGWDERFAIFGAEMGLACGLGASTAVRHAGGSTAATATAPRPEVVEAWRLLTATRGRIRIEELAARVFLGRRRLSTVFAAEFGLTPKEAARTMRFSHAVARIGEAVRAGGEPSGDSRSFGRDAPRPDRVRRGSFDLARIAAECGFADQAHLDREFAAFAGTSPSGWIAEEFPNIQAGGHRYAREWEA